MQLNACTQKNYLYVDKPLASISMSISYGYGHAGTNPTHLHPWPLSTKGIPCVNQCQHPLVDLVQTEQLDLKNYWRFSPVSCLV